MSLLLAPLHAILCAIQHVAYALLGLVVGGVNAFIVGLAAIITGLLALLPEWGDLGLPSAPAEIGTVSGWVAWVIPVGTIIDIVVFLGLVWLAWQAVAILLRWVKATEA